jgi:hypothetical protein
MKQMMLKWYGKIQPFEKHLAFIFLLSVSVLLLWRNPFSARTLIPNLEPYPDTFHYIIPVANFLDGKGFTLARSSVIDDGSFNPSVPQLYSLALLPSLAIKNDPRMFYFTNIILFALSVGLLASILRKLEVHFWWQVGTLFIFVTSYHLYWMPSLAMAENLLVPVFLLAFRVFLEKSSQKMSLLMAMAIVGLYASKYASLPASLAFTFLYLHKLWREKAWSNDWQNNHLLTFIVSGLVVGGLFSWLDFVVTGKTLVTSFFNSTLQSLATPSSLSAPSAVAVKKGASWFSLSFIPKNLPLYARGLIGFPQTFLWDSQPFWPSWLAWFGWLGIAYAALRKNAAQWAIPLIIVIASQWIFMSTFYVVDIRYIIIVFPSIFIGLAWLGSHLRKKRALFSFILLALILVTYSATSIIRLKKQVSLNLKYSEQPWYYLSVLEMNAYFSEHNIESPVVISAMNPYFIDFYRDREMSILPLSATQDFMGAATQVWGPGEYSDLLSLYATQLQSGKEVYLEQYGLGNVGSLHAAYAQVHETFELELVRPGCYNLCNLYRVREKKL